ncbi:MAG: chemotaxis protein CheW [Candidatus Kapabacteria bacterium]|nr:chemotaxis protein CheW [Ignavibacteriota bacterium]MCW5886022.1 chemotaxis protein CheW [Candidatus Kapabacteria bacterium]
MLILPLEISGETYAMMIDNIKEIIPVVEFIELPSTPEYIKGMINYRGRVCPVIDLSILLKNIPSKIFLSTRIIMIDSGNENCSFGLLAQQITETVFIKSDSFEDIPTAMQMSGYIDKTMIMNGQIIPILNPKKIYLEKITIFHDDNTI